MSLVLDRKLVLEERVRAPDGAGGFTGGWQAIGEHWAALRPAGARREAGDGHARSRSSYRLTLRAVPPGAASRPVPGQRFREGSRVYRIRAVSDQASDARYLVCTVDEELAP